MILNVFDAEGNWATDSMIVTVNDREKPTANAGPDKVIDQFTALTFDGIGSVDNVGITNYSWAINDSGIQIVYGESPDHTFNNAGTFIVILNVSDAEGNRATDSMVVTVNDREKPIANAGSNSSVDQFSLVTFDGSGSFDNVEITNYTWLIDDSGIQILYGVSPNYTFNNAGTFIILLNITDASGNWNTDTMVIMVNDTTKPIAKAGSDQTVVQHTRVKLNGSGSIDNIEISNYTWTFLYNDLEQKIYGPVVYFTFEEAGICIVTLNVTDKNGNWGRDDLLILVRDITPPIADAGGPLDIDQGDEIVFDGGASTDNVGIINHSWEFICDGKDICLFGGNRRFSFYMAGEYNITLTVTDKAGNSNADFLLLIVRDITAPVADAGNNQTAVLGAIIILDASQSSDNVGILNYSWRSMIDDNELILYGMEVHYLFEEAGAYTIQLIVEDAIGNHDVDEIIITIEDITRPRIKISMDGEYIEGDSVKLERPKTVLFNAANSTDDENIKEFQWIVKFRNEEKMIYGDVLEYDFDSSGVYEITLIVTDTSDNYATCYCEIIVEDDTRTIKDTSVEEIKSPILVFVIFLFLFLGLIVLLLGMFIILKKNNKQKEMNVEQLIASEEPVEVTPLED